MQTISRLIKCTLLEAGVNTDIFKSRSTRAAATAAANRMEVPLDHILATAGWSDECTFRKYNNKPINRSGQFAERIQGCVN